MLIDGRCQVTFPNTYLSPLATGIQNLNLSPLGVSNKCLSALNVILIKVNQNMLITSVVI